MNRLARGGNSVKGLFDNAYSILKKYSRFIGPGLMVSVAYMDPGNYSTAVAAGSAYKYKLLFSILLSNCLAIFLQILSAKLGAVTGLDLAANCKANLSFRVNIFIYCLAELAIIATDLAEVVGTAISLNILFDLPLLAGVIVTVVDVLIVLMAYRPKGPLLFVRIFESFVSILVAATVVCFAIELYQVSHEEGINFSTWEVIKGFMPNEKVVDMSDREGGNGLYLSLAILGATVMPHSLYLGSGLVQARLKDYDIKHGHYKPLTDEPSNSEENAELEHNDGFERNAQPDQCTTNPYEKDEDDEEADHYRPSIHSINDTMTYTIVELVISLFTVALFVNSAILIVAGATLNNKDHKRDDGHDTDDSDDEDDYQNADLFTIYNLLSTHLSPTAGFVFALALLCSGQSAGVVCTLAGQMVLEGFLLWSLPPIARRLITRGLAIVPCLVVVTMSGREGLSNVLNMSQVVLAILLPVVSAPLIWFTCSKEIMKVPIFVRDGDEEIDIMIDNDVDSGISRTITTSSTATLTNGKVKRFKSTEPAIRLQDLRNSHPCAGWDEDEIEASEEQQRLISHNNPDREITSSLGTNEIQYGQHRRNFSVGSDTYANTIIESEEETYRVKGYKDMSNGPATAFTAVLVWGFITCLNVYLLGSLILGYDVPI
mmetsp:Transcript_460/g.526  ORF Transcript_460/g.526 Transcript_460/m.526 type:complete len:658 (+) Transcript_460:322-2295(+)